MRLEHLLDLAPSKENPRNSEGAFLQLGNGRTLLIYSRFSAGLQDDATADLYGMVLGENRPESDPFPVLRASEEDAKNLMSVSLMRMENGDAGLFYLRREGETGLRMYLRRSADDGRTWSEPVCATPRRGYFVVNNDRVVRTAAGAIIIPAAEHSRRLRDDGTVRFDSRAEAVFFCSRDDGRTFAELRGKGVLSCLKGCESGLQEPGLLEGKDGTWWSWARTDLGRQAEMFSRDEGRSWTSPAPSGFTSPLAPLSMKRLADGRLLAIYNPVPLYDGRSDTVDGIWNGGRTPLCARLSEDDGRSFSAPETLESDPGSGYCYTAMLEEGPGRVLLAYCAGGPGDGNCLTRLRLARLWLNE